MRGLDKQQSYRFEIEISHEAYKLWGIYPKFENHTLEAYVVVPTDVSLRVVSYGKCTEDGFVGTRAKEFRAHSSNTILPAPTKATETM